MKALGSTPLQDLCYKYYIKIEANILGYFLAYQVYAAKKGGHLAHLTTVRGSC